MLKKILIIDDEEKLRSLLTRIITLEGFEVLQAWDCKSGLKKLAQDDIDVVLCDVRLPDGSGVELAKTIKGTYSSIEIILLTAFGNIPDGVQAIKNGAFDYIIKGDDNSRIIPLLYNACEKATLAKRVRQLEKQLDEKHSFDKIIGKSRLILQAVELAKKVAKTDTSILLTGETGTGKEIFAQAIHHESNRHKQNFVALNCSAFSKDLLESEMFGHKAGSFTGASRDQKGLFEEAHNGTIFLDELGEMALDLQAKLLRVIESGEFIKVGETKPTKVNVRIIAATNRDLKEEIEQGHFREDLYYRISVFQIPLPPLRERVADLEILVPYFIEVLSHKMNKKINAVHPDVINAIKQHPWKGNIRELKNVLERAIILNTGHEISLDDLPIDIQIQSTVKSGKQLSAFSLQSVEKLHIQKVLNHTHGNKAEAARLLEIGIATLYRKIEEYRLSEI
ncbi:sigma-54-dependent transcriptional regulator [Chryseobacterium sp.]|uniref:sigma-54-dependent transcriptional regulator n=1 Tax=Chryseobacterium sp. TaxID=1871047 RepID=UPI001E467506|nr:sigma-54 dependent transcriptional regulator [Chryseobacterium sp.]